MIIVTITEFLQLCRTQSVRSIEVYQGHLSTAETLRNAHCWVKRDPSPEVVEKAFTEFIKGREEHPLTLVYRNSVGDRRESGSIVYMGQPTQQAERVVNGSNHEDLRAQIRREYEQELKIKELEEKLRNRQESPKMKLIETLINVITNPATYASKPQQVQQPINNANMEVNVDKTGTVEDEKKIEQSINIICNHFAPEDLEKFAKKIQENPNFAAMVQGAIKSM